MLSQKRGSIIFPIIFLLALIAGGLFLYKNWETTIDIPAQLSSEENLESKLVIEPTSTEAAAEEEERQEAVETIRDQEFIERAQELLEESEELIAKTQKFIEEEKAKIALTQALINLAKKRSNQVKGVYMTEFVANSQNPAVVKTRENIKNLLADTELNGVVIDVKEAYGPNLPNSLKKLLDEFHQKNIWVIARICAFRDSSLIEKKPEWYIKTLHQNATSTATSSDIFWKDRGGAYWLDPSSPEVQDYIIEFSKKVIDFGFDELQFDYIRFPSDGDLENTIYPFYDGKKEKYEVIREFFLKLSDTLKSYKPSIILSVDLFGYVATQLQAFDIGQRLMDAAYTFDYISFMLYPSHFYGGFKVEADLKKNLPALYFPYISEDVNQVVSNHPYEVVYRSVLFAFDCLSLLDSQAKVRPWLQDFTLKADTLRGIDYDAEKVKAQITAAEDSGASGWLLWNPSNIYTKEALKNP